MNLDLLHSRCVGLGPKMAFVPRALVAACFSFLATTFLFVARFIVSAQSGAYCKSCHSSQHHVCGVRDHLDNTFVSSCLRIVTCCVR